MNKSSPQPSGNIKESISTSQRFLYIVLLVACVSICLVLVNGALAEGDRTAHTYKGQVFHSVQLDLDKDKLSLFWKSEAGEIYGSFKSISEALEAKGEKLTFATNAGMFTLQHSPVGLHIEEGKELTSLDQSKGLPGNFYLDPNGVFFVDENNVPGILTTDDFAKNKPSNIRLATQSGPMLVVDGEFHEKLIPSSDSKHIRSGVGVIDGKKIVFSISAEPVNFYTFAELFRDHFGCKNALYLDGSISHLHAPELGREDQGSNFGGILGVRKMK